MTIARKNKYWKYAFWVGPLLIVMGLTAGVVSAAWVPVPTGLVIAGIVILIVWFVLQTNDDESFWGKRSTVAGSNALAATLSVLLILGLLNFMAVRYPLRIDLTENQQYTLAAQSRELVRSLKQPLKVWIFDRGPVPPDKELLENYRRQNNGNFSFEYVDPQASPALAQQYGVTRFGEVHLQLGERKQFLMNVDQQSRLTESKLTNGIAQITSTGTKKVYFLQGHGESGLTAGQGAISEAVKNLENKNITSETLYLSEKGQVPEDAEAVVIAGPKRALFEGEVKALKDYLNAGGSLMVMVDPQVDPKLGSLLEEWGIKLDNRLAIDASGIGQRIGFGPAEPLITTYGEHPITKDFKGDYSVFRGARPLETRAIEGIEQTPILVTNERSWAESNPQKQPLTFNADTDKQGPLVLGVVMTRKAGFEIASPAKSSPAPTEKPSANATPSVSPKPTESPTINPKPAVSSGESRLVVIGNSSFATDGAFEEGLNGDIFLNSVGWLSNLDSQLLSIRPKEVTNRRINLSAQQGLILGWMALAILPLIGLVSAGLLWWSRR
ncbi:MAG TPA: Gldg family protein [Halomicronema sp.]